MIAQLACRWRSLARWSGGALPEQPAGLGLLVLLCGFPLLTTAMHRWFFYLGAILMLLQPALLCHAARAAGRHPVFVATLLYLGVHLSSIFWSPDIAPRDVGVAALAALGILLTMLFAVHVAETVPDDDIARLWTQFQLFAAFLAALLIALDVLADPVPRLGGLGQVKNPIMAGVVFGAAWLSALAFRKRLEAGVGRIATLAVLLVLAAFVVLTDSRGPMLGVTAGTLALLALERRWLPVAALLAAAAALLALLLAGAFDQLPMIQRGDTYRLDIWSDAWTQIGDRPWLGHGALVEPRFYSTETQAGWKSTHSLYLGTLFYTGIVGLAALLAVLGTTARSLAGRSLNDVDRALASLLFMGVTISFVEFHTLFTQLDPEWLLFWIPIALLMGRAITADRH